MISVSTLLLLLSAALVLFMTPGLSFFYGGLVRSTSVVNMLMLSFGAAGVVGVLWAICGANMASVSKETDFSGNPFSLNILNSFGSADLINIFFDGTFAILTIALISGCLADRAKFSSWLLFAAIFAIVVYFPVAAWVWGGGWIETLLPAWFNKETVLDFAGGTVVHINAGAAALALALVLGKRIGFGQKINKPHNIPLVLIGVSILWFGWFGFNCGAAANDEILALNALNTFATPCAALISWLLVEKLLNKTPSAVSAACGIVSGLVAITPACDQLTPLWAIVLGFIAGAACCFAVEIKWRLGYDDSLDVVGVHLVGGFIGCIYLGFFSYDYGLLYGQGWGQLGVQLMSSVPVAIYSFAAAYIIGIALEKTIGFRVSRSKEKAGIDKTQHGEKGYAYLD